MMDEEIQLLHELILKLGVTLTLAMVLFGVYFFMARKRAKKVPRSFLVILIVTLALYILLILNESELILWVDLWEGAYLWTKFAAYLGTAFFLLKAADLLVVDDFLVAKKGLYIPDLLRLLVILAGLAGAGLVLLRTVLGINLVALVAIPTAATAIIGFALQDTLKRFFAGLMLGKLVRVGDWVCVAGKEGRVTKVDLGHVTIVTREDDLVLIPNNLVAQQDIVNRNKPTTKHACTVLVDAAYEAPPLQVQAILIEAAKAVPGVQSNPAPEAFVSAFKDSSIQYRLKFWITEFAKALDVEGQLLSYVWYAFRRNGIEIPFPQRTVHMTQPEDAERTAAKERERIIAALRRIDFLSVLGPETLEDVAMGARIRVYLPGEAVFYQGEAGAEFFFILEGHAEVRIGEGEKASTVATLNPMQFFGEMSLLTGEPRSATIVAQTGLEVMVLTKEALTRPIMENPVLAERISAVLAQRKSDDVARQQQLTSPRGDGERELEDRKRVLGARIRKFFGRDSG